MQLGFYFDQTRCIGCYTCMVACKDWNDIPAGIINWRKLKSIERGDWPNLFAAYLSYSCNHCSQPICAEVCPAKAIKKRKKDGIVVVDRNKCREASRCGIITDKKFPFGETQSPCTLACPAGINVQGYIALIAKRKFKEALELIRRDMPLPSVCGRVCQHPCEAVCKRQEIDNAIAIMHLKRFVTDRVKMEPEPVSLLNINKKVAVIGSGPAGLSAAWALMKNGYPVTVFEALPVAGGMLAVGIPDYRLPKKVLKQDIDYLRGLGIQILTNKAVGRDLTLEDLKKQGFSAILIATGAHRGSIIGVNGSNLKGTFTGISFLYKVNMGLKPNIGSKVVIIGGGHVAIDCARVAYRLGSSEIHIICLEDRKSMPASQIEIEEAIEEGIVIHNSVCVNKILEYGGEVCGVEYSDIVNLRFLSMGNPRYDKVDDSQKVIKSDSVIFAIGQYPELSYFPQLEITPEGFIAVDKKTFMTNIASVFAVGEVISGPSSVVDAIFYGKLAAKSIQSFLENEIFIYKENSYKINPDKLDIEIPSDINFINRFPVKKIAITRRRSFDEVSNGYSLKSAVLEAKRCLNCAGHLCKIVCPYDVPQFDDGDIPKMQMCNFCVERWTEGKKPICVEACPTRAIDAGPLEQLKNKYGDASECEGFQYFESTTPSIVFKTKNFIS